ncbi:MAG: LysR family transcriptional regulator [Nevskiaceae bacterium]|nr:MAG: LysR family transcriptional regulator [Nevskiaceae bacterium]
MDTQALAAFVEVAEYGSFSRAGETLHLSQPAISKRIAALEEQLDRPLFDRVGRRITLTDAGRTLLPYARRVLQDVEDGRRALSHLSDTVGGRLSIGTSHHIGLHRLPPVLREFTRRYPDVDLDIHFMDSEVACQAVLAGKLEIGIVTLPTQSLPHLEMRLVWPDPLTVVVAPEHPLARKKRVALPELAQHPAVLPDEATYTHRIVKAELQKHGVEPRIRLATNYLETLKMLVGIGLGWSVLPRSMIDGSIRALSVSGLAMQRDLGVVWHERRTLSGGARALLQQLQA